MTKYLESLFPEQLILRTITLNQFELSQEQARKLVLLHQGLHKEHLLGRGKNAALKAIEQLGYVQIDTISVIERAHHHVLWSRALGYQLPHLDALQREGIVFEYWSHAAAYLPMRDYRFSLPRKLAYQNGEKHWFDVGKPVLQSVLQRIREEGPLQSKDFDGANKIKTGWGEFKIAKRALEQLFMRGELMISKRVGFQKVYDLPERVLPDSVNTKPPTEQEYLDHLIFKYLDAQGLAKPEHCGHLRKGLKPKLRARCQELLENGDLAALTCRQQTYVVRPDFATILEQPLSRQKIKILSPFDNLIIQRDRALELFNLDYQLECYVPEKKRRFGYFVLPILWGQSFAGRMDAKIERQSKQLRVKKLFIETPKHHDFLAALRPELDAFCRFTGGESVVIGQVIQAV